MEQNVCNIELSDRVYSGVNESEDTIGVVNWSCDMLRLGLLGSRWMFCSRESVAVSVQSGHWVIQRLGVVKLLWVVPGMSRDIIVHGSCLIRKELFIDLESTEEVWDLLKEQCLVH